MNQSPKDHPATQTLRRFIKAMNQWETKVIADNFKSSADLKRRGGKHLEALAELYCEFCEKGATPHRLTEMNWGVDQPDYNPKTEKITSARITRRRAVIETRMGGGYDLKMRYELVLDGDI